MVCLVRIIVCGIIFVYRIVIFVWLGGEYDCCLLYFVVVVFGFVV